MTRPWSGLLLGLVLPAAALAQGATVFWEDPDLASAVRAADLIVLGEAAAVDSDEASFKVVRTLHGPAAPSVIVHGLRHPELDPCAPIDPGERAYLVLLADVKGPGFHPPTSTFGRFPLKVFGPRTLVVTSLGDTFTRVPIEPERFERLVRALRGGESGPLLEEARAELERPDSDPPTLYGALRLVAYFGDSDDVTRLLGVLDRADMAADARWKVRMAAADGLGRAGGATAVRRLMALAANDPVLAVRTEAALALEPALRVAANDALRRETGELLGKLAQGASGEPIDPLDAGDPRTNRIEAPLMAYLRALATIGPQSGIGPALRALERKDDLDAVVAGLTFFEVLNDPTQAGAIAWRMREPGAEDELVNRLFARTLQVLTGQSLGFERARWVKWWQAQALTPQGPEGPR